MLSTSVLHPLLSRSTVINDLFSIQEAYDALNVQNLDDLFLLCDSANKSETLTSLYKRLRTVNFLSFYRSLLGRLEHVIGTDYYFQALPTIRIQWPSERAGTLHIDSWVGHGSSTINFWLPITPLDDTCTVWLSDSFHASDIITSMELGLISLQELEVIAKPYMRPARVELGSILTFNNSIIHGSYPSQNHRPRISLDFRICVPPYRIGIKKLGTDYLPAIQSKPIQTQPNIKKPALTVIYSTGLAAHLSHATQRAIIYDFCAANNFEPVYECSEYYNTPHYPKIHDLLKSNQGLPIILATSAAYSDINYIRSLALSFQTQIFDAFANKEI